MDIHETFEDKFKDAIEEASSFPIESDEATTAFKNLKTLAECQPSKPEVEETEPVPATKFGRFCHGLKKAASHDNAGIAIKVVGGVVTTGLVIYATIHKDHVLERQALGQATASSVK